MENDNTYNGGMRILAAFFVSILTVLILCHMHEFNGDSLQAANAVHIESCEDALDYIRNGTGYAVFKGEYDFYGKMKSHDRLIQYVVENNKESGILYAEMSRYEGSTPCSGWVMDTSGYARCKSIQILNCTINTAGLSAEYTRSDVKDRTNNGARTRVRYKDIPRSGSCVMSVRKDANNGELEALRIIPDGDYKDIDKAVRKQVIAESWIVIAWAAAVIIISCFKMSKDKGET